MFGLSSSAIRFAERYRLVGTPFVSSQEKWKAVSGARLTFGASRTNTHRTPAILTKHSEEAWLNGTQTRRTNASAIRKKTAQRSALRLDRWRHPASPSLRWYLT
jgi:hypothetical protein